MLSVHQVSLSFGGSDLFKGISFQVNPGDRIGLVGRNGAGKSTLLKLIAGRYKPDSGKISYPSDFSIGFLTQDMPPAPNASVWDEAASSFTEIKRLEADIESMTEEMGTRTDYESDAYMALLDRFHHAQERFQHIGGYTYQADLERVLLGLGFKATDFHQPLNSFSGGWQMRVELAKILLQHHDVLLLDEPTNHLDIESILWLEEFLAESNQAIILVSHDRTFLNNATNRTLEIVLGKGYDYNVPYFKYLALRDEIREKQRQAKANQDKEIKHTQELVDRFRAKASKAAFAQSLIKKLDRIEVIEVDDEDTRQMRFKFPPAPHSGKIMARLHGIHKHYGPKHVLRGLDLEFVRGQKIAFVGQNGQGKSTLVKILTEGLAYDGQIEWGHQVQLGYYAQNQAEVLDGTKTVLETIEDAAPDEIRKSARKLLGNFMFGGDDVEKKVRVLSGGERGRLALCQLMLNPINLLVLDEPTNHLDMAAKDVLKQALLQYDGTLIVVSHDREFLEGLCNLTLEFRDGKIKPYLGGIEYFLEQRKLESLRAMEVAGVQKAAAAASAAAAAQAADSAPKRSREEQKRLESELRSAQKAMETAEKAYEAAQAALDAMDAEVADPEVFKERSMDPAFFKQYEELQHAVHAQFDVWAEAQERFNAAKTAAEGA
ncbi:MAG: ABC-F family ATP-binding cassette domain-containing protein [Schleiferiaceae bacterium]